MDMGDKEAKFVGSRQWIGSTEVSYVLDHLFGVRMLIFSSFNMYLVSLKSWPSYTQPNPLPSAVAVKLLVPNGGSDCHTLH